MKKILFIAGNTRSLIANRGDLIRDLRDHGYEVAAIVPEFDLLPQIKDLAIEWHTIPLRRTGINPVKDFGAIRKLYRLILQISPDVVYSYTIKPVIYGSLCAARAGVPVRTSMITGMGYLFTGETLKQRILRKIASAMYGMALRRNHVIFFQNPDDRLLFSDLGIVREDKDNLVMTNGSGVNMQQFPKKAPAVDQLRFLVIARLLQDKGIYEFVEAATRLKEKYPEVKFRVVGPHDPELPHSIPKETIDRWQEQGKVEFPGGTDDVRPELAQASVYVLPSYREGTPRSVLEAMCTGRPVITTDTPGCRETVKHGETGYLVPAREYEGLYVAMEHFILNPGDIPEMGEASYQYAKEKYDVHKVNKTIIKAIGERENESG